MKATLAVLGLVLFAVLAECKPAENLLRKRILEKIAARGGQGGKPGGKPPRPEDVKKAFDGLYATCETGEELIGGFEDLSVSMDSEEAEALLAHVCPHVLHAGELLAEADEDTRKEVDDILTKAFPAIKCAFKKLLNDLEDLAGEESHEDKILNKAGKLFDGCTEHFDKDVQDAIDKVEDFLVEHSKK